MAVMERREFAVRGMTCGNCARHVTRALEGVPGVSWVQVDLAGTKATVEYDPEAVSTEALAGAVERAGYALVTEER
jgi:copper chaperone CopZ